jgi:hypothetical protein
MRGVVRKAVLHAGDEPCPIELVELGDPHLDARGHGVPVV